MIDSASLRLSLLAALLGAAFSAQTQNLIVNGGFESTVGAAPGSFQHLADDGVPRGWYASTGVIEIGDQALYGVGGFAGQVAELDSNFMPSSLSQTFSDTVSGASAYVLSFDYAFRDYPGVTPDSGTFDVLFNNVVVASLTPTTNAAGHYSILVPAVYGANTLTFRETSVADGTGSVVDNVSVQPVPEPAPKAALGPGALSVLRRRERA